jgi:YrbI family 3-deoxy-D-manno-octulosonate 8-phosphate phosphatase
VKLILTDVDGVLTDGRVTIDLHGNETKTICYRDLDAVGIGRLNGYDFAFVTGEDTEMVRVLAKRFSIDRIYAGAKDKLKAMRDISNEMGVPLNSLLYIGDSDRDAPALQVVGLGIAPRDASFNAKTAAHVNTESMGGFGVLLEVVNNLVTGKWRFPEGRKM